MIYLFKNFYFCIFAGFLIGLFYSFTPFYIDYIFLSSIPLLFLLFLSKQ